MTSKFRLLVAASVAAATLVAPVAARADWRGGGYYRGGYGYHGGYRGYGPGPFVAGALLGLGTAAVVGGVLAPRYYAPPPVYYAPPPPAYYPPPVYYAPPPGYYVR